MADGIEDRLVPPAVTPDGVVRLRVEVVAGGHPASRGAHPASPAPPAIAGRSRISSDAATAVLLPSR